MAAKTECKPKESQLQLLNCCFGRSAVKDTHYKTQQTVKSESPQVGLKGDHRERDHKQKQKY
ncbi:CLUMA_CG003929, isoform A [Clunio marinus]|uniref:CLUMA_CG003929, isoform A n=1 Tax=Clunio marinus TaxID=568069 RepID=A0A1J1HQ92_9DIPT|nr:CLUMA_CG003929, isoform A [Clunio marinus]